MDYILQLGDGKMFTHENGMVGVVTTGYPYPDSSYNGIVNRQYKAFEELVGVGAIYNYGTVIDYIKKMLTAENQMFLSDFKHALLVEDNVIVLYEDKVKPVTKRKELFEEPYDSRDMDAVHSYIQCFMNNKKNGLQYLDTDFDLIKVNREMLENCKAVVEDVLDSRGIGRSGSLGIYVVHGEVGMYGGDDFTDIIFAVDDIDREDLAYDIIKQHYEGEHGDLYRGQCHIETVSDSRVEIDIECPLDNVANAFVEMNSIDKFNL